MPLDNRELIRPHLKWDDPDKFYSIQIIKRRKDNPGMSASESIVDHFYVYTAEKLAKYEPHIISMCELKRARAYISMNRRSAQDVAYKTLAIIGEHMQNRAYRSIKDAYHTAVGKHTSEKDKLWLLDIDDNRLIGTVDEFLKLCQRDDQTGLYTSPIKPRLIMPSKSGTHYLVPPFNLHVFQGHVSAYSNGAYINPDSHVPWNVTVYKDPNTIFYAHSE